MNNEFQIREQIASILSTVDNKHLVGSEAIIDTSKVSMMASASRTQFQQYVQDEDFEKSIEWADLTIRLYEHLARSNNESLRHSSLLSAMLVRAKVINSFKNAEHPLLDASPIGKWFYESLEFQLEEARNLARSWRALNNHDIKRLRYLKSRIAVLESVAEFIDDNRYSDIHQWLDLKPELP